MTLDVQYLLLALLIVTVATVLVWLELRRRVRAWREQSTSHSTHIRSELEATRAAITQLEQDAGRYPPTDPAPYRPLAQDLHKRLALMRRIHANQGERLDSLSAQGIEPPDNPLAWLWFSCWREPRYWHQRRKDFAGLYQPSQELRDKVNVARSLLRELHHVPLQVARQAQRLQRGTAKSLQIAEELRASGVHGDTLDSAQAHAEKLTAALLAIPPYFLQGPDSQVMEEASKESAIATWRTLEQLQEPIGRRLAELERWQSEYRNVGQRLKGMQRMVKTTVERLDAVPPSVDSQGLVAEWGAVRDTARQLEGMYPSLTLEDLARFELLSKVTAAASRLIEQTVNIERQLEQLRQAIPANAALLKQIATEIQLAQIGKYPLAWEEQPAALERLHQLEAEIGAAATRRTPEQLDEHVTLALKLTQAGQALYGNVTLARDQRYELISLLERPALAIRPAWLTQSEDLYEQTRTYALKNWPKELAVSEIWADAKKLAARHEELVPLEVHEPLPVAQLGHLLGEVQRLATDLSLFQNRLQLVAKAWFALQALEQTAQQELETTLQAVERFVRQLDNAEPPIASTIIQEQQKEGRGLVLELERRHTGLVEKKTKNVDAWVVSCHKAVHSLLVTLQTELKNRETQLRARVEAMQEWAPFDRERAMVEAQALLAVERHVGLDQADASGAAQIAHLVDQSDPLLQERERLHIALRSFESQIVDRVNDQFEILKRVQREALREYDGLIRLQELVETDWPPLLCDVKWARDLLGYADRDRQALQYSGKTVLSVRRLVDKLIKRYEDVIAEVAAKKAKSGEERQRVRELRGRIERWIGQLEAYRDAHSQEPAIVKAVQARLDEIERAINRARNYRRGRPLTYNEVEQLLQQLWVQAYDEDLLSPSKARDIGEL